MVVMQSLGLLSLPLKREINSENIFFKWVSSLGSYFYIHLASIALCPGALTSEDQGRTRPTTSPYLRQSHHY